MSKVLLSLHVLVAILAVGPVAVAASMYAAVARSGTLDRLRLLHRICRVYGAVGIAVPLLGLATANTMGVLGEAWLLVSIGLTAVAAAVLLFLVLPGQGELLEAEPGGAVATRLSTRLGMTTGLFNLLWATVTVLMIVRPGSTTGA